MCHIVVVKDSKKKRGPNNDDFISIVVFVFSCLMNSRYIAVSGVPLLAVLMSEVYSDSAKAQRRRLEEVTSVVARLKPERR
jgi:hypothetical protein